MSKKVLMNTMVCIIIILFLLQGVYNFFSYNIEQIHKGKVCITLHQPETMQRKEYIDTLLKISNQLSIDILYERIDDNMNWIYYKTNLNEDFLHIYTEKSSILLEQNEVISTNKELGIWKIYGLQLPGEDIVIKDFSRLIDIDLTNGRFWVLEKEMDNFIAQLNDWHIECETGGGVMIDEDEDFVQPLIIAFIFFLCMAVMFYVFSKVKDFAIKKSMGYSNFMICILEIKDNVVAFCLNVIILCLLMVCILTFLFDFISSLYCLKMIILPLLKVFGVYLISFILATCYICMRCRVQNIKGKRQDNGLSAMATVFKTITFVFFIILLSEIVTSVKPTYQLYKATMQMRERLKNYAKTTVNTSIENPDDNLEKYDVLYCNLYRVLHNEKGAIIAYTSIAKWGEYDSGSTAFSIDINDNYLDFNDRIYDLQGNRITSAYLQENRLNILIPPNCDYAAEIEGLCRAHKITEEQIHLIEYSSDSEFFSFDNENHPETGGYFKNPIAVVFDETMINDAVYRAVCLDCFFCDGLYFKTQSESQAYEEIYPYIKQCGLTNVICSTPSVKNTFNENLKKRWQILLESTFELLLYLVAFIAMLTYSAESYFTNHAKEISTKLMQGYTLLEILELRLVGEGLIMILLLILSFFYMVSIPIACMAVGAKLVWFYSSIKKQCNDNLVEAIKGEY